MKTLRSQYVRRFAAKGGSLAVLAGVMMTIGSRAYAAAPPQQPTYIDVYNSIKAMESQIPLPQPQGEVNMGTFDAASGRAI